MAKVTFRFLDRNEVQSVMPPMRDIMSVVEEGLRAHGRKEVVLPPKSHIDLDERYNGHFNILVGWVGPIDTAGVKVVGDYVDNYKHGLPSEVALVTLYDPRIGIPKAIMDGTDLTTHRTGAVTGIGAKHLAPQSVKVVGHLGARGTAYSNIEALSQLYDLDEVRITSKRAETRTMLAEQLRSQLSLNAVAVDTAEETVRGADIVVEATRLEQPTVLIKDEWLKPDCLLVTYGWVMATDPATVKRATKVVVDDWEQCCRGGQLQPLIQTGELTRESLHGEIGEVVAGAISGREADDGIIVFWHRGFAISDIMLGSRILREAERTNVGSSMTMFDREDE